MTDYNVSLDFVCEALSAEKVHRAFEDAQDLQGIGEHQYQATYGLDAPNVAEAYRITARYVLSKLALHGAHDAGLLGAVVYGPDENHHF